jgi:maltooligosyltrehalose trehalohydrolase
LLQYYRELIDIRKQGDAPTSRVGALMEVAGDVEEGVISLRYWEGNARGSRLVVVYHLGEHPKKISIRLPRGTWTKRLDSADERWRGSGSRMPDTLFSEGEVTSLLSPWGVLVYESSRRETARPGLGSNRDDSQTREPKVERNASVK